MPIASENQAAGPDAPADWLADHGDYLFAYAMRRLANPSAAEDMVQETLLAAIDARQSFDGRSARRTWLTGILRHKLADHLRSDRRRSARHRAYARLSEQRLGTWVEEQFNRRGIWRVSPMRWGDRPEALAQDEEFRAALVQCLRKLPDRAAAALVMLERQAMPLDAAARSLELSANALAVLLHRARAALRRCLELTWFRSGKERDAD